MTQQGYLIARNRSADAFFTSASSYERPSWVSLTEAKKYATAEMAQAAATKLYRHGAYEARIVSLQEAMAFDFPDENVEGKKQDVAPVELPNDEEAMAQQDDAGGMVAAEQQPAEAGDENNGGQDDELEDLVDQAAGEEPGMKPRNSEAGEDLAQRLSSGEGGLGESIIALAVGDLHERIKSAKADMKKAHDSGNADRVSQLKAKIDKMVAKAKDLAPSVTVGESATIPAKPPLDAQPSENDKTANKLPKTPAIKYKDPLELENPADDESANSVILPHDAKIKVPAEVMTALSKAIAEFDKGAVYAGNQNDDKASFCMTVADAFKALKANLDFGTVAGLKAAQIQMTSWMNPITSHLPEVVQKFIYMGGRKPTLQNMFDMKRPSRV